MKSVLRNDIEVNGYTLGWSVFPQLEPMISAPLKTNFFRHDKRCPAFKLDPGVLPTEDYPQRPFGLYFFVGRAFISFHIRFRDIARGGIRMVKSRHHSQYRHNLNTILLKNYNLAYTYIYGSSQSPFSTRNTSSLKADPISPGVNLQCPNGNSMPTLCLSIKSGLFTLEAYTAS